MSNPLSLEEQILAALRRITRAIDLRSRTLLQDFGLTAPQLAMLHAISRLEPATAGALAREIHLGQPTVTGILNRLERQNMVERVRSDQDRRTVQVSLTEQGRRVLSDAPSLLQDQFRSELEKLREWERTQILATLQRIADMMDASGIEAAPVLSSELTADVRSFHIEEPESGVEGHAGQTDADPPTKQTGPQAKPRGTTDRSNPAGNDTPDPAGK